MSGSAELASGKRREAAAFFALALSARLGVVAWAATRIPPTDDGAYYHVLARRIAEGAGYTWLWPDGVVTAAAHYPVGYPALVGALYAALGPAPVWAMVLNAALGALGALAAFSLARDAAGLRAGRIAGFVAALHPGLLAYTPALMTEIASGSLLACAAWAASGARREDGRPRALFGALLGLLLGLATLVRPQALLLAPVLGALSASGRGLRKALWGAALATSLCLAVVAPWTARNCAKMGRCALVSVNGGWNLLIGTAPSEAGGYAPLRVPDACREVFREAEKDACFGREAVRTIAADPLDWVALAPRKLGATFDAAVAGSYHLHAANPHAFGARAKAIVERVEVASERLVLLACLVAALRFARRGAGPIRARLALGLFALGAIACFTRPGYLAYLTLPLLLALPGRALLRAPVLYGAAAAAVATTALVHATFFGAGRYAVVTFPLLAALAGSAFRAARGSSSGDAAPGL